MMKKLILLTIINIMLISCTKQNVLPLDHSAVSTSTSNMEIIAPQPVVTFKPSTASSVFISRGVNTLQTDSFFVSSKTAYITKLIFVVSGSVVLSNFKFYLNGGEIRSTITNYNDTITVVLRKKFILPIGNYNFILQAKTNGNPGAYFYIALNSTLIVDENNFMASILNLPAVTDSLTLR